VIGTQLRSQSWGRNKIRNNVNGTIEREGQSDINWMSCGSNG